MYTDQNSVKTTFKQERRKQRDRDAFHDNQPANLPI